MAGERLRAASPGGRRIVVALAGNPNCGKTTIFNAICGARHHVGNYPGVTVERRSGVCRRGHHVFQVIDLPGTYALQGDAEDERIARESILREKPDVVVNIVDASNLERNLYLTAQLLELGVPLVIALNMSDVVERRGERIDEAHLGALFGAPVIRTVGHRGRGLEELLDAVVRVHEGKDRRGAPRRIFYGRDLEEQIETLAARIGDRPEIGPSPRWIALKLLESDPIVERECRADPELWNRVAPLLDEARRRIRLRTGEDPDVVVADRRFGFVHGAVHECFREPPATRITRTERIDRVLASRIFGLPIFLGMMWLVFTLTFRLGEIPMHWIEFATGRLETFFTHVIPPGILQSLIVDGVIAGVGGVVAFLPQIMILFLAIALLEDTGYMARAAFLMDRVMHMIGLHGKSFIPLLIGFGCSVPAYMASRTLESRRDRLVTMHVTTFMSCGARLPVYVLICGTFWPGAAAGNVMFSVYLLGIVMAIVVARVLRGTRFRGPSEPFVMELPPYRMPTVRGLLIHSWERGWQYLRKAGTIILAAAVLMWMLMSFPRVPVPAQGAADGTAADSARTAKATPTERFAGDDLQAAAVQLRESYAGRLGRFLEPALRPLGFDWRLGVTLVAGAAAKEIIVSTMGTLYSVGETEAGSSVLQEKLASDPAYNPLIAYAFLIFVLLYMPCVSAITVFYRESGSWRETLFQIGYTTALAYVGALVVYQGGRILGLG